MNIRMKLSLCLMVALAAGGCADPSAKGPPGIEDSSASEAPQAVIWTGRLPDGSLAAPGEYGVKVFAWDLVGNQGKRYGADNRFGSGTCCCTSASGAGNTGIFDFGLDRG